MPPARGPRRRAPPQWRFLHTPFRVLHGNAAPPMSERPSMLFAMCGKCTLLETRPSRPVAACWACHAGPSLCPGAGPRAVVRVRVRARVVAVQVRHASVRRVVVVAAAPGDAQTNAAAHKLMTNSRRVPNDDQDYSCSVFFLSFTETIQPPIRLPTSIESCAHFS